MSNPFSGFKFDKWWHAIMVVGGCGAIACLAFKFDFVPQKNVFLCFIGMFLFGLGQWIDHHIQAGYHVDRIVSYTTEGYHFKPSFFGVCLDLLGSVIFVVEIYKIMVAK